MSRLDGNERWKTKMLLTEHQEEYENRRETKRNSGPTSEELVMIRDSVLLPHMQTMIQRSMEEIEHSTNILKRLHALTAQALLQAVSKDLYDVRRELKKRSIRIISDEQSDNVLYYHFICRGYQDRFGIVREVARSEISVRLAKYVKDLVGRLKEEKSSS